MFKVKKNRKGDLILDINLNPFPILLKILSSLDIIFTSKIFYSIPMGLGIGFGIGIVIFSNPASSIATTPLQNNVNNLTPYRITLEKQNFTSVIKKQTSYTLIPLKWSSDTINFINFPNKNAKQTIIATKNNFIENVKLGEKIKIEASNNGIYHYSIFHIKEIASKDINSLMSNNNAKLIILNPTNILGSSYLVALAK